MQFLDLIESRSDGGRWGTEQAMPAWMRICAGLVLAAAFSCSAQDGHPVAPPQAGGTSQRPTESYVAPQAGGGAKQTTQEDAQAADNHRKRQISDESTQLLALAVALKAEVDKTNKDVLSINVIRKADEIERLAHTVKEKIKQGSGPG